MSSRPRTRHHVNPLSFRHDLVVPDWAQAFARPGQPLEVDVGCAQGTFLLERARRCPEHNLVGLEIRAPMVERVQERIARAGLDNAVVVLCNANLHLERLFAPGAVRTFHVHFPDPWFKKRHHKRRLLTPAFVEVLASRLEPGGAVEFMTDVGEYAEVTRELFAACPAFVLEPPPGAAERALSHREEWHEQQGDRIHRQVWRRPPAR